MSTAKLTLRRLLKDRQSTLLNILGLSTGLACVLLILLWTTDEQHIDKYNTDDARLYQLLLNSPSSDGHEITTGTHTPGLLASTLKEELPEVESAVAIVPPSWHDKKGTLSTGDQKIATTATFIGKDFFRIFSFPLLAGQPQQILQHNNDIVISADLANKLFNTTDCIGKTLQWDHKNNSGLYRISGVFQKPPANVTLQFDLAFSYDLFLENNPKLQSWGNNDPATYVLLKNTADITTFNNKIKNLIKSKRAEATSTLFAQQYSRRYLHGTYENGHPAGGRIEYVRLFDIIAGFILIIACINFMNLSTAKAAHRIKEAGIKKIIGASRTSLIMQYFAESLLLAGIGTLIAIGLAAGVLPQFNQVTGKQLHLDFDNRFGITTLGITVITGLLAGSYPAIHLSSFKPVDTLASRLPGSVTALFIRKGLVVFQFAISALFMVSVLVVYQQMELVQTKNLGYNRDNLLYFSAPADSSLLHLIQKVKTTPGVLDAGNFGQNITNRNGGTYDIAWPGKDPNTRIDFTDLSIGYRFIETAGIKIKAGRSFSPAYPSETTSAIIFNQAAIDVMGLKDPIGKIVRVGSEDRTIIGVVENFNFQSLHEAIKPCYFDCRVNGWTSNILVRIAPGAEQQTIGRLQQLFKDESGGLEFDYGFLDDDYNKLYVAENRVAQLSKYAAILAILISCLGLFALAAYTAQQRRKEIGIRKVVGAGVTSIISLLGIDFLKLVALALLIAFPIAAWLLSGWLHSFAYRVPLQAGIFGLAGAATILITLFSIGWQCIKAALVNPIDSLRSE